MSALFNFHSFLSVVVLLMYLLLPEDAVPCHPQTENWNFQQAAIREKNEVNSIVEKMRFRGFFWKAARIGERLSPRVAAGCFTMGVSILFF